MALDDTFKALSMFSDGMQQLAVSKGIADASDQVNQINQSAADEMQKRQMRMQAANQLALHLVGAGANASQVQQASTALAGPQANDAASLYQQGVATGDQSMIKLAKSQQQFENDPKMQQISATGENEARNANIKGGYELEAARIKLGKQQQEMLTKNQNMFNNATKDIRGQLDTLDGAGGLLDMKNPISDAQLKMQLPRILGDGKGRLPIQEIQMFTGSQSLVDKLKRAAVQGYEGITFTPKDREDIAATLAQAKGFKEQALAHNMQLYAGQGLSAGAYNSMEHGLSSLQGNDPRLKRLSGLGQSDASAGAAAPSAGQQAAAPQTMMMRNRTTGKVEKVYVDASGKPIGPAQ